MTKSITVLALLLLLPPAAARANYKTISVTAYYSIAVDGAFIWGGSSGNAPGWTNPPRDTFLWRFNPTTGATDTWSLRKTVGMKGAAAFILPMPEQVIVGISGSEWADNRNHGAGAPDPTYSTQPNRARDGGLIRFNRATSQWSLIDIPVYDVQGYDLVGDDLWLSCGLICNPRKLKIYRYNLKTGKLDYADNKSDSHCIAVAPQFDRAYTGTHHGNYMEILQPSTMKLISNQSKMDPPSVAEQVLDNSSDTPKAANWKEGALPLIKAMVIVDDELWVNEPMGAWYAKVFGGLACFKIPAMKCLWASPATWQYTDLGDETALDLKLDPIDHKIIWASGAKGLYQIQRLPGGPKLQMFSMDGLPDHNIQHIAVDAQYVWAGTEQGFLYRFEKGAHTWTLCGQWQTGLSKPTSLETRKTPGAPHNLSATAEGPKVTLEWQPSTAAHSYFIRRDGILISTTAATNFIDAAAPTGEHTYAIIPCQGAYLKGGLIGPAVETKITVANGTALPVQNAHRPTTIHWGTGDMQYVPPLDLYVDVYEFPNQPGEYPMTCVTWPQAKQLAEWQGKRLPTNAEYLLIARGETGKDWDPNKEKQNPFEDAFWAYNRYNSRQLEKAGSLKCTHWGIQDLGVSVNEWLSEWSPLGDGHTYGPAAGGSWPQVSFPIRTYAPYAEYPEGCWARDPNLFNHSEIGFRCVLSGSDAQKLIHLAADGSR